MKIFQGNPKFMLSFLFRKQTHHIRINKGNKLCIFLIGKIRERIFNAFFVADVRPLLSVSLGKRWKNEHVKDVGEKRIGKVEIENACDAHSRDAC